MPNPPQPRVYQPPVFYLFKTTTAKLTDHLQHIVESGDAPLWPVFVGGRDWTIICRKGSDQRFGYEVREHAEGLRAEAAAMRELAARLTHATARGVRDGQR